MSSGDRCWWADLLLIAAAAVLVGLVLAGGLWLLAVMLDTP